MKVKIISKLNCQSFPLDDTAIDITYEQLEQIGKTKCFDVENNRIIDYDGTEDLAKQKVMDRIAELKQLLADSDYRAIKFAEGEYTEEQYAPYRALRQSYRKEINELEKSLN